MEIPWILFDFDGISMDSFHFDGNSKGVLCSWLNKHGYFKLFYLILIDFRLIFIGIPLIFFDVDGNYIDLFDFDGNSICFL